MTLAEQIEALDGPSREMDARIAVALIDEAVMPTEHEDVAFGGYWLKAAGGQYLHSAKPYTGSVDEALSLMPDGKMIVIVYDLIAFAVSLGTRDEMGLSPKPTSAKTLPLAICAAAIRAIEEQV